MTVRLSLTRDDEERIERQLSSGRYADAEEVVRAGLQALEDVDLVDQHDELKSWLDSEITKRLQDLSSRVAGSLDDPSPLLSADEFEARMAAYMSKRGRSAP